MKIAIATQDFTEVSGHAGQTRQWLRRRRAVSSSAIVSGLTSGISTGSNKNASASSRSAATPASTEDSIPC